MDKNTHQLTLKEVLRPLMQFCLYLLGKEGQEWLTAFKRFLRKENPWDFKRWKGKIYTRVRLGKRRKLQELIQAIKDRGFKIQYSEHYPTDLLVLETQLKFNSVEEQDVHFALASPKDLGLKPGWTKQQLYENAPKYGLEPCLSGDILEIVAQGKYQLGESETIDVAMWPINIANGGSKAQPSTFTIGRYSSGYHLGHHNGNLEQPYPYPDNVNNKHLFRVAGMNFPN